MPCTKGRLDLINVQLNTLPHERDRAARRERSAGLTQRQLRVLMAVYLLSQGSFEIAYRYVEMYGDPETFACQADAETWFDKAFSEVQPSTINRLLHPAEPHDIRIRDSAVTFLSECAASGWVAEQNFVRGVAPSSALLALACVSAGAACPCSMKVWACRFRRRWEIRFGKLRSRSPMPADEVQHKACHRIQKLLILGSALGAQNWGQILAPPV